MALDHCPVSDECKNDLAGIVRRHDSRPLDKLLRRTTWRRRWTGRFVVSSFLRSAGDLDWRVRDRVG